MATWSEFATARPDLAALAMPLYLLDTPGGGLGYLATLRSDGAPRIHPISPALLDGDLYAFVPHRTPKRADLARDGRYALHSWPRPFGEETFDDEEFAIAGRATPVADGAVRDAVAALVGDDAATGDAFELLLERVMHTSNGSGAFATRRGAKTRTDDRRAPVSTFEDAIEIDAPPERTFALTSDPRYLPFIDPSATVRLLSGGWTEVGSRHHVVNRVGRALVDSTHEITRLDPPRLLEERITSRGTVLIVTSEVRPLGTDASRSVLVVRGRIEWGGSLAELVARLLSPLSGPPSRRRMLRRIKAFVETGALPDVGAEAHLGEEG